MRYCFREKLEEGGRLLGTMVTTFASADLPKILARCGFDFFVVDCEHGSFTTREVADMLAVARAIGLPGVVRIPELRREHVLKFLEMGAEGLLLPNTESAEQAQQLVDWAKYAPMGHRGVSLNRPHTDFEKVDGRTYMEQSNRGTVLMAQIESREGVEHVAEIMAVDGIDLALIGPNDMSQDYGLLGQYTHPEMEAAFAKVFSLFPKIQRDNANGFLHSTIPGSHLPKPNRILRHGEFLFHYTPLFLISHFFPAGYHRIISGRRS